MKVCLISLPSPFLINDLNYVNLGVLYISAYLKGHGIKDVQVVDLATRDRLPDIEADIIGISSTTPQFPEAIKVFKALEEQRWGSLFVIGGPHATCHPKSCIDAGFDVVVRGDGELPMLWLAQGAPMKGVVKATPLVHIDFLPDREAIDMSRYGYDLQGKRATNIMTSRGCPFSCSFCCKTQGSLVRYVNPKLVTEDVRLLRHKYGFDGVVFFDDEMNYNLKHLLEVCRLIKPLKMAWRCLVRAKPLNLGLLKRMRKSGCVEVQIGVESGSDEILRTIKKGTTVEDNLRAVELIIEAGIRCKPLLMIGNPGESWKTVEETKEFLRKVRKLDPEMDFDLMMFTPYPLSDIWEHTENYDIQFDKEKMDFSKAMYKQPDPLNPSSWACAVRTSHLSSSELIALQKSISDEFGEWGVKLARGGTINNG